MDSYDSESEQTIKAFQLSPRKSSEENVRMSGNLNHFETFDEDNIEISQGVKGKRISSSGSIVVLDIDFVTEQKPTTSTQPSTSTTVASRSELVANASISLSNDTPENAPFTPMSAINNPSAHVSASSRQPRLDSFGKILDVLSKCDRFSTKDIDCFKALSLVAEALFLQERSKPEFSSKIGKLVVNPNQSLGLAFDYAPESKGPSKVKHYAFLDISPGSRPKYSLRDFTKVSDWLNEATGEWVIHTEPSQAEARAELCLTSDPPIYLSDLIATQLDAVISNGAVESDARRRTSSFSVPRHPRFTSLSNSNDVLDIMVGNMSPFQLVKVTHIPLESPAHIANILTILRQFTLASTLIQSVLKGGEPTPANEAAESNIADALELRSQPVHNKHMPLSIAWRCVDDSLQIDIVWTVTELEMSIILPREGGAIVQLIPDSVQLNMADIEKSISSGNLDSVLSYAISSAGRMRRRSTTKF